MSFTFGNLNVAILYSSEGSKSSISNRPIYGYVTSPYISLFKASQNVSNTKSTNNGRTIVSFIIATSLNNEHDTDYGHSVTTI